ncbi:MAG: 50S ribosomal protein L30 [Candidatus Marinimicrobia bacterium]|jgi:large subunit ribosomal protein L30|nr:50S ribosomal protein L30 [Candidatus Neomarinimicrobiota bacterium]|tara:strand:- start:453 stop:638 length:186 start_codon:yes stop_codon:yes gene_type:complete
MAEKKLIITQTKSAIGYRQRAKDTLTALGLKKMNATVTHDDSPAIRGMITAVGHLLKVEEA